MEKAAETWSGEWWTFGGGGTVWDAVVYDEVNNTVVFGTGNGTPWNANARGPEKGDNLYVASIVAVSADSGEYAWHYQAAPGDTWDYDNVSPMMLVNLQWEGQERRVVLQPSKNGFMYVLDAASG
jgi:glucose dehydrogenase